MKLGVLVGEIMQKNIKTAGMDEQIMNAARMMKEEKIGSVVVMGGKHVKGIITTSDIVYKHVAEGTGKTVSDIMTTDLVIISPDKTIEEAARLLVSKGVEKLLVFDAGKLVGIITANDILRVEPALVEILMELLKAGRRGVNEEDFEFHECEVCGNYSDDIEESDGVYTCKGCRD